MGLEAKKDILSIYTNFDAVKFPKRATCHVKIRSVISISNKDIEKIKRLTANAIKNGLNVETRCVDMKKEMTYNVLIGDDKSALLIWEPTLGEDMVAFWTDSEVFVHVWREFFEALWSKGTDMNKKLQQLKKQPKEPCL